MLLGAMFCLVVCAPAQTLSPTSLVFPSTVVGSSSKQQVVTLTNGPATLTITSISTSGDFSEVTNCPLAPKTLAPSASCKIGVTFTPTALGLRTGTLTVSDNAPNPQTAQLSGTGVSPVTLSPTSLGFGNQFVNKTSAAKTVTVKNYQTVPLTISSISTSGNFGATWNCPLTPNTLGAGATCTIYVTFTPAVLGTQTGALTVNDSATNSPQIAQLSGSGVAPVTLTPSSLSFPSTTVTITSKPKTLTLKNAQTVALTISSIATSGDFAETSACPLSPQTLAAGATCTVSVTFTPTAPGTRDAILTVTDNASVTTQTASLTGTGNLNALSAIEIAPPKPQAAAGTQLQLTATGEWQNGQTLNITNFVAWSSSAPAIALVNSNGLVQAVAQGTATITASYGSVNQSVGFTSTAPVLTSITVSPSNPSVPQGGYQQFTAVLNYSDGSWKDATTEVGWSSSASTVATVNSSGLATALTSGGTTITATVESVSGGTNLTVSPLQCTAPPAGLVGWWTGDGDTVDIAGSNSGTLQNGASYGPGEVAQGFSFSGNNASVLVNAPEYSPTTGTLMFWFMSSGGGVMTGSLAGSGSRAPGLSIDSTGNLDWEFGDLFAQSVGQVSPNQWHFVALTYSTGGSEVMVNVYLDENQVATAIAIPNLAWYPQVVFGSYLGASETSFVGSMDEIAIFNQALTGQQVQQVYTGFAAGMCKPTLQSISVNPANPPLLAPGAAQQFTAAGAYSDNSTHDLTSSATWSSSTAQVATITPAALATGVVPGTTTIGAALEGQNGSTILNVGPSLVSIQVNPVTPTISYQTSQAFSANGTYSDNSQQNITNSVAWSANPQVATIAPNGVASAVAPGQTAITATVGSMNGSGSLTVTSATLTSLTVSPSNPGIAAGTTQQFTAMGTFSDSSQQDLTTQVSWTSSSASVATINASGLGTSFVAGQVTITASFGSINNFTTLTVTSAVLIGINVSPANPSLLVQGTQQFTATGIFSDGSQQDLTSTATWASSNQNVASINATGLGTALALGSTTIGATFNEINGGTTLTVINPPPVLESITVSPASTSIAVGLNQAFTAQGSYSDGSTPNITNSVQWSSSNTAVATISNTAGSNGLATGAGMGSTTLTATLGSVFGTGNLTVTAAVLGSIEVTPQSPTSPVGQATQFTATGIYTDGSSSNITNSVSWTSSVTTVAAISNAAGTQGLATSVGSGSSTISASLSSVAGSTILAVQDQLVSISIAPSNATIVPGTNQQYSATGTYLSGIQSNVTDNVLWYSSVPAVAIINSTGLAISAGTGQTVVTASVGSISGSANLAVTPIQHVVIILQENRTPDNLFHGLPNADIANSGLNSKGQVITLQQVPLDNNWDMSHAHSAFVTMYDNGKMDGNNLIPYSCQTDCPPPPNPGYSYVNPSDVAPYFQLAEEYTFGDRMFQTNQGPSFPAHQFIISGTSAPTATSDLFASENPLPAGLTAGCTAPSNERVQLIDPAGNESQTQYPCFEHPTIVDELDNQSISWRYYAPSSGSIWTGPNAIQHLRFGPDWTNNVIFPNSVVLTDIANGNLPAVSWVIPTGQESDHPALNDGSGPSWVSSVVNEIGNSPYWSNTAILISWDDWGGWYDHVAPQVLNSYEYGFRVPLIVVSPYAKPAYVSHVDYDFGSFLKFIEETFNLPSLGYADSFANDLSDCFDFSQAPFQFQTIDAPLGPDYFLHDTHPPLPPDDD